MRCRTETGRLFERGFRSGSSSDASWVEYSLIHRSRRDDGVDVLYGKRHRIETCQRYDEDGSVETHRE
jgi:hypothetical protein